MHLQKEAIHPGALEGLGALLKLSEEEDVWTGRMGIWPKDGNGKRTVGDSRGRKQSIGCLGMCGEGLGK